MKKTITALLIAGALISTTAQADFFHLNASEVSLLSGFSVIVAPFLSSAEISRELAHASTTNRPIAVKKIEQQENNKTKITSTTHNNEPMDLIVDSNKVKDCNLKVNDAIFVKETKVGYILNANNSALGIVPNEANQKDFNQKKVN